MSVPAAMFLKHVAQVIAERSVQYGDAAPNMSAIMDWLLSPRRSLPSLLGAHTGGNGGGKLDHGSGGMGPLRVA